MVWLTKLLLKIGEELKKRFPEMMSLEAVEAKIKKYEADIDLLHRSLEAFEMRIASIERIGADLEKIKVDLQKLQSLSVVKSKVAGNYQGNMNPWPLPPVMPGPTK